MIQKDAPPTPESPMRRVLLVVEVADVDRFMADIERIEAMDADGNIEAAGYAHYDRLVSVRA